jgi:cyclic pyranopterin phosphate synthase
MIDAFGRELTYLRISVIDRCNLQCTYCMPHGLPNPMSPKDLLTNDELVELAGIFVESGISKIRLTGGEPLLRPGLVDVVARLRALPGLRELALSTNGLLVATHARALKSAGLDRVNISLDTLSPAKFRAITGVDRWQSVMDGILAARAAGLTPIKLNAVLMKGMNDDELVPLTQFAIDHGFDMRFIEWMPTNPGVDHRRDARFMSCKEAWEIVSARWSLTKDDPDPHAPARSFHIEGTRSRVGFISPLSSYFCASCNRLRLKCNGRIKTCLHGPEELDLKVLLRSGAPRSAIRSGLESVVFARPEQHFLNEASVPHREFVMTHVGG